MEINKALSIIYSSYNKFQLLPESMSQIINKGLFQAYLQQNSTIDPKIIELFLNIIFDENEEDQNNIPRDVFNSKYENLLKLIEEDNEEEDNQHNNININKGETPTKGNQIVNFCSPILIQNSTHKNENDTSIEAIELFKDIKFKEEKISYYHSNDNDYNSVIRPSNNFNFNNNNEFNKQSTQSSRENRQSPLVNQSINLNDNDNANPSPIKIPKLSIDFNLDHYKKHKKKFINYNSAFNPNTPHKSYTIQQKIQDVYFQIHKTNDMLNQVNSTPIKQNAMKNYYVSSNQQTPSVLNSHFIRNKDYFSHIYRSMANNPLTNSSKVSQLFRREKRNDLYHNYTRSHNKAMINHKLEGLNKMLNSRSLGLNEEKILNADDFITLEEKMNLFSLKKKGSSQSRSVLKTDFIIDNKPKGMTEIKDNNINDPDIKCIND